MGGNEAEKVVVILGANGGIGFEIARKFLEENATLILPYHHKQENIRELQVNNPNKQIYSTHLDLTRIDSIEEFVKYVEKEVGHINVLVNNAGISRPAPLEELTPDQWDEVLGTNVRGSFFLSQKVLLLLKKASDPTIVNVASMSGHEPYPGMGAYSTSKSAFNMITKQMAAEWAKYNIRVNAVSPGLIRTPLTEALYQDEAVYKRRTDLVPLKRIGSGEEVANIVKFLASVESAYITGQSILADGGLLGTIQTHLSGRPESN